MYDVFYFKVDLYDMSLDIKICTIFVNEIKRRHYVANH